jgi:hypothetical protein
MEVKAMIPLKNTLISSAFLASIVLTCSEPASAVTIFAEAILNGGAPVTLTNSSAVDGNFSLNSPVTLGGTYVVGTAGASAYPLLQPYPNFSTQLQVSAPNSNALVGDTIEIRFTEASRVPGPISPFDELVGLTANVLTNFSVQSGYWYDDGNQNFALSTLIADGNPTFGSPLAFITAISPTSPYTITADYILTVTSAGFVQSNLTTDLILQVPEPFAIALIGTGLAGLGVVRSRRRRG